MTTPAPLPPLRREIVVEADPDVAFAVFTDRIGSWWPVAQFSVYGADASVAFRDGAIVESVAGRPDTVWGTVTTWQPPDRLAFTWHPGADPERASLVTVTFTITSTTTSTTGGPRTLVRLEHSGWEAYAEAHEARTEYGQGWPTVLASYGGCVTSAADRPDDDLDEDGREEDVEENDGDDTWVALLHRPGPHAGDGTSVLADPRFSDHVAFLQRMGALGYLVAAGPLADEPGAGMTVLRLPGPDRLDEATRLAEVDDISVATGFLTVSVRPWRVVLTG